MQFSKLTFLALSLFVSNIVFGQQNTKITCKISNRDFPTLLFSGKSDFIKDLEWEKEISFDQISNSSVFSLDIATPTVVRITYDYRYFEAFLMPGDSLSMSFDGQTYPTQIDFSGKGAVHNRYLHEFKETFLQNSEKNVVKKMCISPPLIFKKWIEGETAKKWDFYRQYNKSEKQLFNHEFNDFARAEINYWNAYFLTRYYKEHLSLLSGEKYYIPDAYFDFLDETLINNDAAFLNPWYRKFLKDYGEFRIANLDFLHGLASRQLFLKPTNSAIDIFSEVDCAKKLASIEKDEPLLLIDKLTYPSNDGIPTAYRLKVKTQNGLIGWVKSAGLVKESVTGINSNPLYLESVENSSYRDLITGSIKFDTLKLYADQDEKRYNYLLQLRKNERIALLNGATLNNYDYTNEATLYAAPFTQIRNNQGIMGWVSTSGVQLQWKKTTLMETSSNSETKCLTDFNSLDYFFTGKALYYLSALDIRERLSFYGKDAVAKNVTSYLKICPDEAMKKTVASIFQEEDKKYYIDSSNLKIQRRVVSSRIARLNTPPNPFHLGIGEATTTFAEGAEKVVSGTVPPPVDLSKKVNELDFPAVKYNILPAVIKGKNKINRQYNLQLIVYPDLVHLNSRVVPLEVVKGKNFLQAKTFRIEVPLVEPAFGILISDKDSIPVYLQAGDEIELLSGNFGETTLACQGKSASNIKYLQYVKNFNKEMNKKVLAAYQLPSDKFVEAASLIHQEKLTSLNKFSEYATMNGVFATLIENDINYWYGCHLLQYAAQKSVNVASMPFYRNAIEDLAVQNDQCLPSENYRKFVELYLAYKSPSGKIETDTEKDRVFFGEKTLKYLKTKVLSSSLEEGLDNKKIETVQNFVGDNPYPTLNEMIKTAYLTNLAQAKGADIPNFTLLQSNGKKADFASFKGKTVQIEFWDSKCTDWITNFKALKKQRKAFKNKGIVFVYVNLDEDIHVWKASLKKNKMRGFQYHEASKDLYQSRMDELFKIQNLPAKVVLDKNGKMMLNSTQPVNDEMLMTEL